MLILYVPDPPAFVAVTVYCVMLDSTLGPVGDVINPLLLPKIMPAGRAGLIDLHKSANKTV